jgi:hypothetical protein
VFDVPDPVGLAIVWLAMAAKAALEVVAYPHVLPLRLRIDRRFPKPQAAYR